MRVTTNVIIITIKFNYVVIIMYICIMKKSKFSQEMVYISSKRRIKRYFAIYDHNETLIKRITFVKLQTTSFSGIRTSLIIRYYGIKIYS